MMGGAARTDWSRDVVALGRLVAAIVIVVGSALAIWNAIDADNINYDVYGSHYVLRTTISQVLNFFWYGALVLIVAETFSAMRGDAAQAGAINWHIPQLTRLLATIIVLGGTALTVWDIQAMHDIYGSRLEFLNSFAPGPRRSTSDDIRYFLEHELQTYLWQGGLLVLLAALADRLRWRDDVPEEEEASLVATEP